MYLFQKQPEQEKDEQKKERRLPALPLKFVVPIALVVFLILALFAYQRWSGVRKARLEGKALPLPDLRPSQLELVRGTAAGFPASVLKLFQAETLLPSLKMVREEPENELSAYQPVPTEAREASWRERLLYGETCLALRDERAFRSWLDQEEKTEEESEAFVWQEKLGRSRLLFLADSLFAGNFYRNKFDLLSAELLPVFQLGPAAQDLEIQEIRYPQVDAAVPEQGPSGEALSGIPLQSVDLWALQQLAERDSQWQPVFDSWKQRASEALLRSGFYAFAWDDVDKRYIPSRQSTFQADSLACLRQIRFLAEIGENANVNLFAELLLREGRLAAAYHMASLAALNSEADPAVLAEMLRLARWQQNRFLAERARQALELLRKKSGPEQSLGLIFRNIDGEERFEFSDNALALLAQALPGD